MIYPKTLLSLLKWSKNNFKGGLGGQIPKNSKNSGEGPNPLVENLQKT